MEGYVKAGLVSTALAVAVMTAQMPDTPLRPVCAIVCAVGFGLTAAATKGFKKSPWLIFSGLAAAFGLASAAILVILWQPGLLPGATAAQLSALAALLFGFAGPCGLFAIWAAFTHRLAH